MKEFVLVNDSIPDAPIVLALVAASGSAKRSR
jgi:hypothetical protein